jgi:hypothetical protein
MLQIVKIAGIYNYHFALEGKCMSLKLGLNVKQVWETCK